MLKYLYFNSNGDYNYTDLYESMFMCYRSVCTAVYSLENISIEADFNRELENGLILIDGGQVRFYILDLHKSDYVIPLIKGYGSPYQDDFDLVLSLIKKDEINDFDKFITN